MRWNVNLKKLEAALVSLLYDALSEAAHLETFMKRKEIR